jgi:hypothetical protein
MTQQTLELSLRGLYTAPNELSGVPDGALNIADNVVINAKSLAVSRRGQTQYGTPLTIGSGQINKMFNYSSSTILNYDDKMAYDSGNGIYVDYSGNYSPPSSDYKIRSLEALRNFYFTTSNGVYKLDSLTATPRTAGIVRALGGTGSLTGGSGFLLDDSAVAYRMIWGYTDANNNLILGFPSQRLIVANSSGGDKNVQLTFLIPDTITTSSFYQIYRSVGTATAADEPSDELQLVIQGNPTSVEIAAKSFTVVDATPYSLMRTTLYTSPSQEGIENGNSQPPFASDMDVYKTCAFYVNIKQKQNLTLALISVDNPSLGYLIDASVDTTSASNTLTSITDTSTLHVGMRIVGTGIPTDTVISSILSSTSVQMSKNATATGTVSLEFQDRFSLAGVDYWAGSAEDVPTNTFEVATGGTPGQNIGDTANSLIDVINKSASNTLVYAYYTSGVADLPGQILFEERGVGGDAFIATSTAGGSFSPPLPDFEIITAISQANPTVITSAAHGLTTGDNIYIYDTNSTPELEGTYIVTVLSSSTFSIGVDVTIAGTSGKWILSSLLIQSLNDSKQNRVLISKEGQVEAVPAYRFFDIGSANFPIQRVVALRDGIFFFKSDGIYRLSGETFESFAVALVDNTVILQVPESAVAFNNQVYCYTTQGVCAVTDAGVRLISVPIENVLLELSSSQYTYFNSNSFGVAYESARLYMFFTMSETTDQFPTQAFIYNSLTDSWSRWIMNRTCGIVNTAVNKLFMAQTDTGQVLIERKNYNNSDYADEEYSVTITSLDSLTQMTLASLTNVSIDMTIAQGNRQTVITAIDTNSNTITVVNSTGFSSGAAIVYTPILNRIQWAPIDVNNPGILKQFSEITVFFKNAAFNEIMATFSTNISYGSSIVPIQNNPSQAAWGRFAWGRLPWGGERIGPAVLRTYVPPEKQRCSWMYLTLETEQAFTNFSLEGVSFIYNPLTSRIR